YLGLAQVAQREERVRELVLAEAVEEIGLILVLVGGAQEPVAPFAVGPHDLAAPRVMTGRHEVAAVQVPRATEERPELHVRVAVDARRRRGAAEIRRQEGLQDAG